MLQSLNTKLAGGLAALTFFHATQEAFSAESIRPPQSSGPSTSISPKVKLYENSLEVTTSTRFSEEALQLFRAISDSYTQGRTQVIIDNGSAENYETVARLSSSSDPHIARAARLMQAVQVCGELERLFNTAETIEDISKIVELSKLLGDTLSKQIVDELSEIEKIKARADIKEYFLEILPSPKFRWYVLQYVRACVVREAAVEIKAIMKSTAEGIDKNLTALSPVLVEKEWQQGILSITTKATNTLKNCAIIISPRMDKARMAADALLLGAGVEILNESLELLPPDMVHRMHMLNMIKVATEAQGQPTFIFIPSSLPKEFTRKVFIPAYLSQYFIDIEFTASTEHTEGTVLAVSPKYFRHYPAFQRAQPRR